MSKPLPRHGRGSTETRQTKTETLAAAGIDIRRINEAEDLADSTLEAQTETPITE